MACHQRSASWPSSSYSLETNVEKKLQELSASISSFSVPETICVGLRILGDAYNGITEILYLPSNQVGQSQLQTKKLVEEELERSLELLDLCGAMQENFIEMKMSAQELQLVLRRGGDAAVQGKFQAYNHLAGKAKNIFKKISSKCVSPSPVLVDCSLADALKLLMQARGVTIALLQSILSFLSKQIVLPISSKWSLISQTFQKRKITCEEEQMRGLESSFGDLENGIQVLLRQLIHSRVSLLNVLSS